MVVKIRKRLQPFDEFRGSSTSFGSTFPTKLTITGLQTTVSEGHKYQLIGKTDEDIGGDFRTTKDFYIPQSVVRYHPYANGAGTRYGHGWALPNSPSFTASRSFAFPSAPSQLDALGTTAIARTNPLKPTFDGAVYAAELLREGIPKAVGSSLLKSQMRDFRKLGDEYLNFQFGWMPFVSGLKDLARSVIQSEKIISQLYRDNGRNVRRRFQFPDVINDTYTLSANSLPFTGSIDNGVSPIGRGDLVTQTRTLQRVWFSGCFTYHIPMGPSEVDRLQRMAIEAKKLYGARLTPDVLWNLTPWSWAADWFANTGDIMSNVSSFLSDGLVMRYGYVMETKTHSRIVSMHNVSIGSRRYNLQHVYGTTVKSRRPATPYGFGLNWDGFTAYQLGIIGALGISKVPKGRSRH